MSDMAVLTPRTFTVAEYHRIAEAGLFDDERVELLDGIIVAMSPIGPRHWRRHGLVVKYLNEQISDLAFVVGNGSFPLGDRNEPEPDVALIAPVAAEAERIPTPEEIFAMIEVAESSLPKDVGPKARLYARFGIPDYLVVDLKANIVLHYTEPHELGYGRCEQLTHGATFRLVRLPDRELTIDAFLAP
jgi:Uma2 family endonuclease